MDKIKQKVSIWRIAGIVAFIVAIMLFRMIVSFVIDQSKLQQTNVAPGVLQNASCTKSEPYKKTPEFERSISIIKQKMVAYNGFLDKFENCLDIQYDQLKDRFSGPEGVFIFDGSVSSPNDLKIFVDNSYKSEDDYMTAFLLVHEITHAKQFYENSSLSCVDKEVHASWNEWLLLTSLNEGEKNAIFARVNEGARSGSVPLIGINNLIETVRIAFNKCKQDKPCTQVEAAKLIKKQIESSSFYKKQCNLSN